MLRKLSIIPFVAFLFMASCKKEETTPTNATGPATEHHDNDGVKDNGNGSYTVTLGNKKFNTTVRDFSNQPVVTDPKTVSATKKGEYNFSNYLNRFRVDGDHIIGSLEIDALTSKLTVHSTTTNKQTSSKDPEYYIVGLDYNGAMITVEGSEDVNFYMVENGTIKEHFFQIKSLNGSKFLSECFMDETWVYVYNSDEILYFPLDNTKDVKTMNVSVGSFSQVRFVADEKYMYLSVADFNNSEIQILDKSNNFSVKTTLNLTGIRVNGITVDANYIYVSDGISGNVLVYNKHTEAASGSFVVTSPNALDIVGDMLYVSNKDGKKVEKYQVSFN